MKKNTHLSAFILGCIAAVSTHSLLQDLHGMEAWLQIERNHWAAPWITGPISFLTLLICLFGLRRIERRHIVIECNPATHTRN